MRFTVTLIASILSLSACSPTSDTGQAMQMGYGQLRIDPVVNDPTHDYIVTIPSMVDFGFNTRRPADRERYIAALFDEECQQAVIANERETVIGKFPNGNDRIQYSIMVSCIN